VGGPAEGALRQLGMLFSMGRAGELSDTQLLERFASRHGEAAEAAFAALVQRHGPMVWGVCRRVLRDPHEAEDAFQATFLVLVKKAGSIRVEDSLGRWLYGVSYRVASRARAATARRRAREGLTGEEPATNPGNDGDRLDLVAVLDEELNRLPEKYRAPLVLCHLEGLSRETAAGRLGRPVGTIRGQLTRARVLLKQRLVRRGLVAPAGMSLTVLYPRATPAALIDATARVAMGLASGKGTSPGAISSSVAVLMRGEMMPMAMIKIQVAGILLLASGAVVAGASAWDAGHPSPGDVPSVSSAKAQGVKADTQGEPDPRATDPERNRRWPRKDPRILAIEEKLDAPISLNLKHRHLSEAIKQIRAYTGLRILLDAKGLSEKGVTSASPVSLVCEEIKLKHALRYLLQPLGLTYRLDGEVLLITSPNDSDRETLTRDRLAQLRARQSDLLSKLRGTDEELSQLLSSELPRGAGATPTRLGRDARSQSIEGSRSATERRLEDIEQKLDRILLELHEARRGARE
jgi:RNA polymerase sigma factor (sigma-70 family)